MTWNKEKLKSQILKLLGDIPIKYDVTLTLDCEGDKEFDVLVLGVENENIETVEDKIITARSKAIDELGFSLCPIIVNLEDTKAFHPERLPLIQKASDDSGSCKIVESILETDWDSMCLTASECGLLFKDSSFSRLAIQKLVYPPVNINQLVQNDAEGNIAVA